MKYQSFGFTADNIIISDEYFIWIYNNLSMILKDNVSYSLVFLYIFIVCPLSDARAVTLETYTFVILQFVVCAKVHYDWPACD